MEENKIFDLAIIGAGAAGLTASIFASRYRLSNVVFGTHWGGEIANASLIENYPGIVSITGGELTQKMLEHVKHFGAEVKPDTITKIEKLGENFKLTTEGGEEIVSKTVILAMGLRRRHLGVPGEQELAGRGVSYCATCDSMFFKDKVTAVAGGGDAALTAALHLSKFSPTVYMIVRKDSFKGEPIWQEQVEQNPNIKPIFNSNVTAILGTNKVTGLKLDQPYQGSDALSVDGIFVEIGANPDAAVAQSLGIEIDDRGYIKVDANTKTSIPGVYSAGDVTDADAHFDQIISAEAQGGLAARAAFYFLNQKTSASQDKVAINHVI